MQAYTACVVELFDFASLSIPDPPTDSLSDEDAVVVYKESPQLLPRTAAAGNTEDEPPADDDDDGTQPDDFDGELLPIPTHILFTPHSGSPHHKATRLSDSDDDGLPSFTGFHDLGDLQDLPDSRRLESDLPNSLPATPYATTRSLEGLDDPRAAAMEASRLRRGRAKNQNRRDKKNLRGSHRSLSHLGNAVPLQLEAYRSDFMSHSTTGYTGVRDGTREYRIKATTSAEALSELCGKGYRIIDPRAVL